MISGSLEESHYIMYGRVEPRQLPGNACEGKVSASQLSSALALRNVSPVFDAYCVSTYLCVECRRKKLRCDRQRPQCGACVSTRRPCKISNRRVRGASKKGNSYTIGRSSGLALSLSSPGLDLLFLELKPLMYSGRVP